MRACFVAALLLFGLPASNCFPAELSPVPIRTIQLPGWGGALCWDAGRSRFFASAGTNLSIINPETATVESSWDIGEQAGLLAISGDSQFIYAVIIARGAVKRYRIDDHSLDREILLPRDSYGNVLYPHAIRCVPDRPKSFLLGFSDTYRNVLVYDDATLRPGIPPMRASSFHVRPSDHAVFAYWDTRVYELAISDDSVDVVRSFATDFRDIISPHWSGNFVSDSSGTTYDLTTGEPVGRLAFPAKSDSRGGIVNAAGDSVVFSYRTPDGMTVARCPLSTFQTTFAGSFEPDMSGAIEASLWSPSYTWGADGIAAFANRWTLNTSLIALFRVAEIPKLDPPEAPEPTRYSTGSIEVPLTINSLAYDSRRNLLWGTTPGDAPSFGNRIVAINPDSGELAGSMDAGSEPGMAVLSGDESRLFAVVAGSASVGTFDLESRQRVRSVSTLRHSGEINDYTTPISIAPIPAQADSVAVLAAWGPLGDVKAVRELTIYDGGRAREQTFSGRIGALYPGAADDRLYASNIEWMSGDDRHDTYELRVDQKGVREGTLLNGVLIGWSQSVVYSAGSVFTGQVETWNPDLSTLNGAIGTEGIPIPFPDRQLLAVVGKTRIATYEWGTLRLVASYPLGGREMKGACRIGETGVAVVTSSSILLVPLAALLPAGAPSFLPQPVSTGVRRLGLKASAISAAPGSARLLVALGGEEGPFGNSVALLNTDTGKVESSGFIGSEPTLLRAAPDGRVAYAYLSGERRIARYNLATATRDLLFSADPSGGTVQYAVADMAVNNDGTLIAAIGSGTLMAIDNGVVRPQPDRNTNGEAAFLAAYNQIALSPTGTIVYAFQNFWTVPSLRRLELTETGLRWLSTSSDSKWDPAWLSTIKAAGGLLYANGGSVIDPERNRRVGVFGLPEYISANCEVAPDSATGRAYFLCERQLFVFDTRTFAMVASQEIPIGYGDWPIDLLRYGSDGLAFRTGEGFLYLVRISEIPLLPSPVPSPQTSLPSTPGVKVVDRRANDLAYDPSRDRIYATAPNSEAANGDQIFTIDPASGSVTAHWQTPINPNVMTISDDQSRLHFTSGADSIALLTGFSLTTEQTRAIDIETGIVGPGFPEYYPAPDLTYRIRDIAALPGQPKSIAAIDERTQSAGTYLISQPNSLRVFDDGVSRPNYLRPHSFDCSFLVAGADASRLYCSDGGTIFPLAADGQGVEVLKSIRLLPGRGTFGHMVYFSGRIYTTTGIVVDVEAGRAIARLPAQGAVAAMDSVIYWLEPEASGTSVILRGFDRSTLQQVSARQINVTATDTTRLIPCGHGRLAFNAGNEIYIVNPE